MVVQGLKATKKNKRKERVKVVQGLKAMKKKKEQVKVVQHTFFFFSLA
jgi:hypothetical protein